MMNITKAFLLSLIALAGCWCPFPCRADGYNIKFTSVSGHESVVALTDDTSLYIDEDFLCFNSSTCTLHMPISELNEIYYEKRIGIGLSDMENLRPDVVISGNSIVIRSIENSGSPNHECRIYDIKGNLVYAIIFEHTTEISLLSFPKGIYVLNMEGIPSLKFTVK